MIPREKWKWQGMPGHFINAHDCVFHLCTIVGNVVISTLGEYYPHGVSQKKLPIGLDREQYFESAVFGCEGMKECGCCANIDYHDQRVQRYYKTGSEATKGHMELCKKWAKKQ